MALLSDGKILLSGYSDDGTDNDADGRTDFVIRLPAAPDQNARSPASRAGVPEVAA